MGLMMELLSKTEEQTVAPGEATVTTRCLAMFATPMRERAAKDSLVRTKAECKRGVAMVPNASVKLEQRETNLLLWHADTTGELCKDLRRDT